MGRSRAAGDCPELVFTAACSILAAVVVGARHGVATMGAPSWACRRGLGRPCGPDLGPRGPRPVQMVGARFGLGRRAVRRIWYGAVLRLSTRAGGGTGCRYRGGAMAGQAVAAAAVVDDPCTRRLMEAIGTDLGEDLLAAAAEAGDGGTIRCRSLVEGIAVEKFQATICYLRGKP